VLLDLLISHADYANFQAIVSALPCLSSLERFEMDLRPLTMTYTRVWPLDYFVNALPSLTSTTLNVVTYQMPNWKGDQPGPLAFEETLKQFASCIFGSVRADKDEVMIKIFSSDNYQDLHDLQVHPSRTKYTRAWFMMLGGFDQKPTEV
jgi:hypothetical protein